MVDHRFIVNNNKALPKIHANGITTKSSVMEDTAIFPVVLPENPDLKTEAVGSFHWHIQDWAKLKSKSYSPSFEVGGFEWRILLFPRGNIQDKSCSIYIEQVNPQKGHVCGQFALCISNPLDPTNYHSNSANHRFSAEEVDWGFTRFYDISDIKQRSESGRGPFLWNNEIVISAFIRIIKDETGVLWHSFVNYDSRKETGYVGIKNQGATCYMNSLLQSLYFTNGFRKAVYQIPTEKDEPTKSVALALQRCFYNLQYAADPIGTTELTKSFGWDSLEAFKQHDVQEFNRVLQDNLEAKMKGTPADGAISALFEGKMKSFVKCIRVDFESFRVENYYDIQLNVKGCKNVIDSFDDYIAVERLEGDNKYQAEGYGLQDADKGVVFESFPPVLHLQLKRFEYDFMRDTMVKINDLYEFPAEINLDKYCSNSEKDGPYDYELHGVLVHSGDISGGHYFTLICPETNDKWYRFDDDRVTPVTKKEVFEENFGDKDNANVNNGRLSAARMIKKFTNAYMLVYIRKSKINEILGQVTETDIPEHLKRRLDAERAIIEKRKRDQEDLHLYNKVAIVTDESFNDYQGFDLAVFDDRRLEVSPYVDVLKALKSEKMSQFKLALADTYQLKPNQFRLWSILFRQNRTVRVDHLLDANDDRQTIEKMREGSSISTTHNTFVKLYLEKAGDEKPLPVLKSDHMILFIKYFDTNTQQMRGLGHIFALPNDKVSSILSTLIEKAGLPKATAIQLFEEVRPTVIDPLKIDQSFKKAELQHGDIITFQKQLSKQEIEDLTKTGRLASVVDHYASIYNRVCILFKPKPNSPDNKPHDEVKLTLDRTCTYLAAITQLAYRLAVEASKVRFVSPQLRTVVTHKPTVKLEEMLPTLPKPSEYAQFVNFDRINAPVVYYEVLDVDIADLETKRTIEVIVLGSTLRKETKVSCIVPRTATVKQLLDQIIIKAKIDKPTKIRLYEVIDGRPVKEFSIDQTVSYVANERSAIVYAEPVPKDELGMSPEDRIVQVVHYYKYPTDFHGVPFKFVAIKGEPFEETKKRLQKRTGLGDMDWKRVKFTVLRNIHALEPDITVVNEEVFKLWDIQLHKNDALALDHTDKSSKSRFSIGFDKGIFIRG